jgi:hypothetical protein
VLVLIRLVVAGSALWLTVLHDRKDGTGELLRWRSAPALRRSPSASARQASAGGRSGPAS